MKAVIITPFLTVPIRTCITPAEDDLLLCADTAYQQATAENLRPDVIIGDFDHGKESAFPPSAEKVRVPAEKDDTDTLLCLKEALRRGATEICIIGGIGGRLDHTIANLQTLAYAVAQGVTARITDGANEAQMLAPGVYTFPRRNGYYFSLFAHGGEVHGVTLSGVQYELEGATLTPDFPLGVSNMILSESAALQFTSGQLLIVFSKKENPSD